MDAPQILPVLDSKILQEKANEFAMKGAIESIKEYYSGYNSPFRKVIDENLKTRGVSWALDLPDIIAVINESLTTEIEKIANTAVAQSFIPQVKRLLTRVDPEMRFSEVLKRIVEESEVTNPEDCEIEKMDKDSQFGWYSMEIRLGDRGYSFTLHESGENRRTDSVKKYCLLGLPYNDQVARREMMTITMEGVKIEMPLTRNILTDKVICFMANLVMCKTNIIIDCEEFSEDMFPERCHCD